ncbi:MAG: hypothetical protein NVSMB46_08930 [Candidatus Saccharimonadales bacterium]
MRHARYNFISLWEFRASKERLSGVIFNPVGWTEWWKGLVSAQVSPQGTIGLGSTITCAWKSLLGYKLSLQLTITKIESSSAIHFSSHGDLEGIGSWVIVKSTSHNKSFCKITWQVATTKAWMNIFAPILRPVFIYNHHQLMKQGKRGLQRYLLQK